MDYFLPFVFRRFISQAFLCKARRKVGGVRDLVLMGHIIEQHWYQTRNDVMKLLATNPRQGEFQGLHPEYED